SRPDGPPGRCPSGSPCPRPPRAGRGSRASPPSPPSSFVHLDHHVVVLQLHLVSRHGERGRQRPRPPRVQVEGRSVLWALDRLLVHVHLALVEEIVGVRTD